MSKKLSKPIALFSILAVVILFISVALFIHFGKTGNPSPGNQVQKDTAAANDNTGNNKVQQNQGKTEISKGFEELIAQESKLKELIDYLDENVGKTTKEDSSYMIYRLEAASLPSIWDYEDKLRAIEGTISQSDYKTMDLTKPKKLTNVKLKNLMQEISEIGVKAYSDNGGWYLETDFKFLKNRYGKYVTEEFNDFLDIKATYSGQHQYDGNFIAISWDELAKRAIVCEDFTHKYPNSEYLGKVRVFHRSYLYNYMMGSEGTLPYDKGTKQVLGDVMQSYKRSIEKYEGSDLEQTLKTYVSLIESSNDIMTNEVLDHAKSVIDQIKE